MKLHKILSTSAIALCVSVTFIACDDDKMEWNRPAEYGDVSISEIPLELQEKISRYDNLLAYVPENFNLGLGLGADKYLSSDDTIYKALADANFNNFTTGNAMKHDAVVGNNGVLNFTKIDNFFAAIPVGMNVYGHNFIWHTQQNQTYLKKMVAPVMKVISEADEVCENVVDNYGFERGTEGWTGLWGKYTYEVTNEEKYKGLSSIYFTMTEETALNYDSQLFWTLSEKLEVGKTYAFSMYVKADAELSIQFIGQNELYGGIYKDKYTTTSEWTEFKGEFKYETKDDIIRVGIQFGGTPGSQLWVDNFKFGEKKEIEEVDPMINIVTNSDFERGTEGWTGLWGKYTYEVTNEEKYKGLSSIYFTMTEETALNYDSQLFWTLSEKLEVGKTYAFSMYVKADAELSIQFIGQNELYGGIYKDKYTTTSEWTEFKGEFKYETKDDIIRVGIQFGGTPGSQLWVDNFKFGEKIAASTTSYIPAKISTCAVVYTPKTDAEKNANLLEAMESWIKGMTEHCNDRVYAWDVINEPILDGNNGWRGIDGFSGEDTTPDETDKGLSLNWESGHFYWGYYLGKDYACKAFEYARKYAREDAKLFVNDYNLETSPGKLAALIEFVKYIDQNNATGAIIVDGIGTQMHITCPSNDTTAMNVCKAQIDAMFKTMASTSKLIRVTELDVALGTANPSAEQLARQAEIYRYIFESYFANVPSAQQFGITIWTLSDSADEHEYWLKDESPNLWDANYNRKNAYKGVADGLAGRDVSEDFSGELQ